jgi:sulfatase maturation enzyme AslB (radical SAM superfamily)
MKEDSYTILLSNKNTELYILTSKDQFLSQKISDLFSLLDNLNPTNLTHPAKIIENLRKWRESLIFKIDSLGAYLDSTRRENLDQQLKFGEIYAQKFEEILENFKKDKNVSMKIISEGDSYYIGQIGT